MKKMIFILSSILVLCLLVGCCKANNNEVSVNTYDHNFVLESKSEYDQDIESTKESPPTQLDFTYETVDELTTDLSYNLDAEQLMLIEQAEKENRKGTFQQFLNDAISKNRIYMPYYKGHRVEYDGVERCPNIYIHPTSTYIKPGISYYGEINNSNVIIRMVYLTKDEYKAVKNNGIVYYLSKFQPEYAYTSNNIPLPKWYTNVYETQLDLKDYTVGALQYKIANDPRTQVQFIYDDIMVSIDCNLDDITEEDWKELSFVKEKIK